MTTSVNKQLVVNSRERAVSSDINRLQSFIGWQAAEEAKLQLLASLTEETADGLETTVASITTPLTAVFVNGGLCKPQLASTDLFITPSVAWAVYPDAVPSSDDSPVKLVVDPGVSVPGALTLTPGDAALVRIDVVECQPSLTVIETSNRDIFNPATGLFVAAVVNKVQALRWTYRIRLGTPGAGMPANELGWCPLMVARVPALAATWDDCTFCWDVRPLSVDYRVGMHRAQKEIIDTSNERWIHVGRFGAEATATIDGKVDGTFKWWRAGGVIPGNLWCVEAAIGGKTLINESGFALAGTDFCWYFYAAFPFSLPRWCQLNPASSGNRNPMGFRGIPVASAKPPTDAHGLPSAALSLPVYTSLGGTTSDAACLFAGGCNTAYAPDITTSYAEDDWILVQNGASYTATAVDGTNTYADFVLDDANNKYPRHARALLLEFRAAFATVGAGAVRSYEQYLVHPAQFFGAPAYTSADSIKGPSSLIAIDVPAATPFELVMTREVPLATTYPAFGPVTRKLRWFVNVTLADFVAVAPAGDYSVTIRGWKL